MVLHVVGRCSYKSLSVVPCFKSLHLGNAHIYTGSYRHESRGGRHCGNLHGVILVAPDVRARIVIARIRAYLFNPQAAAFVKLRIRFIIQIPFGTLPPCRKPVGLIIKSGIASGGIDYFFQYAGLHGLLIHATVRKTDSAFLDI